MKRGEAKKQAIKKDIAIYTKRYGVKCTFCDSGKNEDGANCSLCDGIGYIIKPSKENNALKMYDNRKRVII